MSDHLMSEPPFDTLSPKQIQRYKHMANRDIRYRRERIEILSHLKTIYLPSDPTNSTTTCNIGTCTMSTHENNTALITHIRKRHIPIPTSDIDTLSHKGIHACKICRRKLYNTQKMLTNHIRDKHNPNTTPGTPPPRKSLIPQIPQTTHEPTIHTTTDD